MDERTPLPGTHPAGARPTRLRARGLTLGYGDAPVVQDLSLDLPDGRVTTVVGANGCGKSTLLRGLCRLLPPEQGVVELDGQDLRTLRPRQVARTIGLLPQHPLVPPGVTVAELVERGRHPHRSAWRPTSREDRALVAEAMRRTDVLDLAERSVDSLSGGQRQRVWFAMVVAQQTDLLVLDEPTSFLDLNHQLGLLDLVQELNEDRGTTVVMVLHDLNLAARYSDHVVAMRAGTVVRQGTPAEVITPDLLRTVFSLEARVVDDPVTGTPLVVPVGRAPAAGD